MKTLIAETTGWLILALLAGLLWAGCVGPARGAPAPFPKRAPCHLTRAALVGKWTCQWGKIPCVMTLARDGTYRCLWCGRLYTGSWGIDRAGRLWITETDSPGSASSWQSYAVQLSPVTRAGPVVQGAKGIEVKLRRAP